MQRIVTRNKRRKTFIRLAIVISIVATGLVVLLVIPTMKFGGTPAPAVSDTAPKSTVATNATAAVDDNRFGTPTRLVIPKIRVDSTIEQMGLTESGDMEAPKTDEDSGWYKYGPRPGNVGSAVIAGHLGATGRAVFGELNLLVKGDTISVTDDKGQTASFVVTGTRMYGSDEAPSEVFLSTEGAHLNLITCEGSWDASQATYSQRLVVFTDRVEG